MKRTSVNPGWIKIGHDRWDGGKRKFDIDIMPSFVSVLLPNRWNVDGIPVILYAGKSFTDKLVGLFGAGKITELPLTV